MIGRRGRRRDRAAETASDQVDPVGEAIEPVLGAVTALGDRLALSQLVDRYGALVDERDYAGLAELFAEDAVLHQPQPPKLLRPEDVVRGREAITENFRRLDQVRATQHAIVGQVFAPDPAHPGDPDRIAGRIAAIAHHLIDTADGVVDDVWHLTYRDRYLRTDGRWVFAERIVDLGWITRHPVAVVAGD